MKKIVIILLVLFLFCGCSKTEDLETVMDQVQMSVPGEKMKIIIDMPDNAMLEVMESTDDCSVYICDHYTLTTYTCESGDMQSTLHEATGFAANQLEVICTEHENNKHYICAWAAAGESGDQVGRCAVIDDGNYHYVLTVMADANCAADLIQNEWLAVFRSFRLIDPDEVVSSGS